jgi:ribosomal protein L11 methyltransferase
VSWALVITAPPEELEVMAAELFVLGAAGVEMQEPGMLLMPGTPALPDGLGRAIAHFEERDEALEAAEALRTEPPVEVPAQDWSTAWRVHHKTMKVGPRSFVYPPWEPKPDGVGVAIDPGMAFGTGSHPTTALCLERTDELLAERPGSSLLDVGTGSGVIAILAAKLGAAKVAGTENDAVALEAARRGEALNQVSGIAWILAEDPAEAPGEYGIVIANILLNTLEELAPRIALKVAPKGRLVLSGLLVAQGDAAQAAYVAQGLKPVARKELNGWLRVELERP